ncbi:MAG: malto-oligosyltrehalose trehalohydrolase [Prolixibacteraceae bacterium]
MEELNTSHIGKDKRIFKVWAPCKTNMQLHLVHPFDRTIGMQRDGDGYFVAEVEAPPGTRYYFKPDSKTDYPDPASHFQPEGVHGPSEVVDHSLFHWQDRDWKGIPFKKLILYELHVGTFTEEGTFEAIIPFLEDLADVGINALELMPVSQFPGNRNWGYDQTYPYAVQNSYGGPDGLKKLINACHQTGIAVFLDVIYNHLGPEGNYFHHFGPYFSDKYKTPWGEALNFDGEWSDGVREYFAGNALHWFENYHADGLRCDAIHMVYDSGAVNFWELTTEKVKALEQELGRSFYLIAESDLNSPKVIQSPHIGGYGFTAQWLDDFHHALYVLLDKKGKNYYTDFGQVEQLAKAYTDGFVHSGEYVFFRKRKHGASSAGIKGDKFVIFIQNHDLIGNHPSTARLGGAVNFEQLKIAAAALMLSPYVPMLFMGEEYGEESPFFYFMSHSEEELIKAAREGRKKEFENFNWEVDPPDPQDEATFLRSKIQWYKRTDGKHAILLKWYKKLISLRKSTPILWNFSKNDVRISVAGQQVLALLRQSADGMEKLIAIFNFSDETAAYTFPYPDYGWVKLLDSKKAEWMITRDREESGIHPERIVSGEQIICKPQSFILYQSSKL